MKIDKNLNLILNMEDSKGDFVVHSVPLPTESFVANRKILMAAYREMTSEGVHGIQASISIASMILRDVAEQMGKSEQIEELIDTITGATTIIRGKPILLQFSDVDEDVKEEVIDRLLFFYTWQFFVPPTQKKEWIPSISFILNLELKPTTIQEISLLNSTEKETSKTTSGTKELTGNTVISSPI